MKKITLIILCVLFALALDAQQYEYSVVTSIESIVPMGIGRSRMIHEKQEINVKDFTTVRTDGKDSDQGNISRSDAKIDSFEETKLLNFYSGVGINFQNVASNDALICSKLNQMAEEGWELAYVVSGVESDAGKEDGKGIFITRYIFKRVKK
ncbi:MAG: hypothetical protein ABIJ16_07140 [Bacteroidota bacterium]